jgi:hypothetical protein
VRERRIARQMDDLKRANPSLSEDERRKIAERSIDR